MHLHACVHMPAPHVYSDPDRVSLGVFLDALASMQLRYSLLNMVLA
jgi:hypothetical protein